MDYSQIAHLPNLQPGSESSDVKTLQKWLIANGYDISDGATGYYGPQTKAAVALWQQQSGIQTNGNWGYFGPASKSFAASQPVTPVKPANATPSTNIPYDPSLANKGITEDVWNSLNATQQGVVGVITNAAKSLYSANASNVTVDQALKSAAADPNLISKYADSLALDKEAFTQSLTKIQSDASVNSQQLSQQQETDRKQLAETEAAAGRAYSGFRKQAETKLATTQSGIITSSRSALQQSLNSLTSSFESKYGTAATPIASAEGLTGQTAGGITGTVGAQKQADITSGASQIVNLGKVPDVIPA